MKQWGFRVGAWLCLAAYLPLVAPVAHLADALTRTTNRCDHNGSTCKCCQAKTAKNLSGPRIFDQPKAPNPASDRCPCPYCPLGDGQCSGSLCFLSAQLIAEDFQTTEFDISFCFLHHSESRTSPPSPPPFDMLRPPIA